MFVRNAVLKLSASNYLHLAFSLLAVVGMPQTLKMAVVKRSLKIHQALQRLISPKVTAEKSLMQHRRQHLVRRAALAISIFLSPICYLS